MAIPLNHPGRWTREGSTLSANGGSVTVTVQTPTETDTSAFVSLLHGFLSGSSMDTIELLHHGVLHAKQRLIDTVRSKFPREAAVRYKLKADSREGEGVVVNALWTESRGVEVVVRRSDGQFVEVSLIDDELRLEPAK